MTTVRLAMFAMFVVPLFLAMTWPTAGRSDPATTSAAKQFLTSYIDKLRPLEIAANRAWWDANITGKDEDFARKEEAQNRIDGLLSNKQAFAEVKAIKQGG